MGPSVTWLWHFPSRLFIPTAIRPAIMAVGCKYVARLNLDFCDLDMAIAPADVR
jgi:hypothetical protein